MTRYLLLLPVLFLLSGCLSPETSKPVDDSGFCAGERNPFCAFVNAPLRLAADIVRLPRRPYPFQPLAHELNFVDAQQRMWVAPKGILTDGASIPPAFVKVVGRPTDPAFAKAAAIHDSYCGVGNEATPYFHTRPWKDTHRMFYEALRVGGTPEKTAKTMFAAVYMGGPRWIVTRPDPVVSSQGRGEVISSKNVRGAIDRPELAHIPEAALQDKLAEVVEAIRSQRLSIPDIEALVEGAVSDLLAQFPAVPSDGFSGPDPEIIIDEGSGMGSGMGDDYYMSDPTLPGQT